MYKLFDVKFSSLFSIVSPFSIQPSPPPIVTIKCVCVCFRPELKGII